MKIIKEKTPYHTYALVSEYDKTLVDYCKFLKATLGWQAFSWYENKWRFKDPSVVVMMRDKFPYLEVEPEILKEIGIAQKETEIEVKKEEVAQGIKEGTKEPQIIIHGIKGDLYPYQKLGVEFFVNNKGRALLADEPGTGKTLQSLAFVKYSRFKRTLVIPPASVKFVWEAEAKKWTDLKTFVVDADTDMTLVPYDTDIVIINYDILKKFHQQLKQIKWECMICDEAHYCKSETSIRSKIVRDLARDIPSIIFLTGTPILSRPIEMFQLLHMLDPKVWNSWFKFAVRYAGGHQTYFGFEAKGATNLDELKQKISKYFLRRTKVEVLDQLPPKTRVEIPVSLPPEDQERYDMAESDLVRYLKEYKKKNAGAIMSAMQAQKLVKLNVLREINAMGKVKVAREMIQNIIDSGEKVIVFSCFNGPILELYEEFQDNAVLITGSTPVEDRGEMVNRFQKDPETKIFFGGIKSGGVGITLTAATNVIFIDYSWNPADHAQAEDRMHRPGQTAQSVNIYNLFGRGTMDGFMKKLLQKKQEIFDKLIEGDVTESEKGMVDEYIKSLEKKYSIIKPKKK